MNIAVLSITVSRMTLYFTYIADQYLGSLLDENHNDIVTEMGFLSEAESLSVLTPNQVEESKKNPKFCRFFQKKGQTK